jgi:hypothetical protein
MAMDLFRKIIDESTALPLIDHITFTGLGETLLDKHLIERIRYTRKKMPAIKIDAYSNGSQLTRAKVDDLIHAGLSEFYVSLNAVRPQARHDIMYPHKPGYDDFQQVCDVLDYAIAKAKGKMRVTVKSIVSKDLMEHGDQDIFAARWHGSVYDGGNAFLHMEGNWAGATYPMRTTPVTACNRALQQIMVLWDGRVSLCCFDGEGQEILGDLNHQTIKEIFNGPKATGIRLAHWEGRRSEIELCANCTSI